VCGGDGDMRDDYDFIIIGAGVTGLSAAMYAARLGLKTLCLGATSSSELPVGGVITTTNIVENYPGFIRLTGTELAEAIEKHARSYDLVTIIKDKVQAIMRKGMHFTVQGKKETYFCKTVLFATGTKWKQLEIPGSKEFENRGVVYCALCDAPLFKNKVVCVVGGSDSAAKDALVVAEHASKVYLIYRGKEIRSEPINTARVKAHPRIEIITETNLTAINGEKSVSNVFLDKPYQGSKTLALQGVFVAIGHVALSDLAVPLGVALNAKKEIIINHKTSETNVQGVYAAGDVGDKPFKQAITGVSEGCTAAWSAYEYISKQR